MSVAGEGTGFEQTIESHAALVREVSCDVMVFPELSLTGYWLTADAVDPADDRLAPLVAACAEAETTALVGAPVHEPGGLDHIAMLVVDAAGVRIGYRKINVGADESHRFAPGAGPAVIDVDGWRLGLAICRDTGIAEHAAQTAALGIDVYVAGVVDRPEHADVQLERCRDMARRHATWVAVASAAGAAGSGFEVTAGRSFVLGPDGAVIDRAGPDVGQVARTTVTRRS